MPRSFLAVVVCPLLTLCLSRPVAAERSVAQRVKAGEIVAISVPRAGVAPGRAYGVINAPAERVYAVLADFAAYENFVPRVTDSKRIGEGRYRIQAKFPWPVNKTWVEFRVKHGVRGKTRIIDWRMESGDLKKYQGTAWIQPYGKQRTMLTYQLLVVPHTIAPDALMAYGLRRAVTGVVRAVRKRVVTHVAHAALTGPRATMH